MTADMKWKLVPVEADDGMIEAGHEKLLEGSEWGRMVSAAEIYDAMLAASPPAPGAEVEPVATPINALGTRLVKTPAPERPELDALVERARNHKMTAAERAAQRRSWVIGEMLMEHPEMSRGEASAIYDGLFDPSPIDPAAIRAQARREALEEAARRTVDEADTLIESLREGIMTDAGLTLDDRRQMRDQIDALGIFKEDASRAIRALADKEPGR